MATQTLAETLARKGISQQSIADYFGVTRCSVNLVIHGYQTSRRILEHIDCLMGWQTGTAAELALTERKSRIAVIPNTTTEA